MLSMRLMGALLGCMFINLNMTTCRSPGEGDKSTATPSSEAGKPKTIELPGVDTSQLTPREKAQWSSHVTELLAPCPATPVHVAECVLQKKDCAACEPAAHFLLTQVRLGRTSGQTEAAYQARFSPEGALEIEIGNSPIKGPPDAPITLVEFADFECPGCKAASPALDAVLAEAKDVRLIFKNYPLTNLHQNAEPAARASVAAGRQGKFWEMHHELFSAEVPLTPEFLKLVAKKLSLNLTQFDADIRSEAVVDAVRADQKLGQLVKLESTPSIFVNGRRFDVLSDLKGELLDWIKLERQLMKGSPVKAAPALKVPEPAPAK